MAAGSRRTESPSEETPLIASSTIEDNGTDMPVSLARGLAIISLMGLLIFIQTTNMSMMTTAQSEIATDLDAFAEATWFTSAYLIAMSSITPLAGRLSLIFTPRVFVFFSSLVLSLGLFITALARNITLFLLGRAVSGCGCGGLMSTSIILVLDLASKRRRGLCFGMINSGYTIGVASGAVLAGLLTPAYGWRCIFWVQAPVALVLAPLLFMAIPSHPHRSSNHGGTRSLLQNLARIDYGGALALTLAVVLLLSGLASTKINTIRVLLSLISLVTFLIIESEFAAEPIVPIAVLKTRSVLLTCSASMGLMVARWGVLFFAPVYAMAVRGWSPASAGLILVPTNAGFGLGGLLVGWIHIRKAGSYYISCLLVFFLFASSTFLLSVLSTPTSSTIAYVSAIFINGIFAGAASNYSMSHVLHLTSPHVNYIVTSLLAMSRGFAGSFGSAIGGGLFYRQLKIFLETGFAGHDELIRKLLGSPALVSELTGPEKEVAVQSYEHAVRMLFLAGSILALAATVFQAGTGWHSHEAVEKEVEEILEDEDLEGLVEEGRGGD
ncbi:hypothetical protein MPDQ_000346 [Monascus purpureus]|uniref:Major facilitator superfamily (MFS) profile domain-containing protein n=1 Tax=Monascus purpureus TaxID=5098 RepID=A0A507QQ58_MONPU|nr:hypothetical protein MPDQ_000346 [Monascus purpureus]BDD64374.1 hypothetical protein MAP00_009199 [Monascus purpureus]